MPPLSENFVETGDVAQGADPATFDPVDTTPIDSTHAAIRAPISS